MLEIIKLPQVLSIACISKSTFHKQLSIQLQPSPISLGARSVGYIKSEIEAVLLARVQGKSDDQVKELVKSLVAHRKAGFNDQ